MMRSFLRHAHRRACAQQLRTIGTLRLNQMPVTGANTKIVCTIGPASDQAESLGQLVTYGMSVARLNFSHAGDDYTYSEANMALLRNAVGKHHHLATGSSTDLPKNLRAILVDTKGPEIRTGILPGDVEIMDIPVGATVMLCIEDVSQEVLAEGEFKIHVDYESIAKTVKIGDKVLLDDGLIELEVMEVHPGSGTVLTSALNGGPIKKNKGVNLPGVQLDLPALTDKDKRDLDWACRVGADFVAASFIRTPANVRSVIAYLDRCISKLPDVNGMKPLRPLVISKIESKEGVDNFDEILEESDGIMVARGDLGVEIPYSKVFAAQRMMVHKCNEIGKPVIVATQMLDSMMRNPRPTRAEVTDVGTAVMDGADAVMLSGETAAGKYPIESIRAMASVAWEADQIVNSKSSIVWNEDLHEKMDLMEQELDAVAASAVRSAQDMGAKMIVLITMSGRVARAVARHRPTVPVLAYCTDVQVARRLQLHRSIIPIMLQSEADPGDSSTRMGYLRAEAVRTAKELGFAHSGDRIIMVDRTVGKSHDMHEFSHNMKVVTLRDS
ncbi:kinase pyruvate kinase 5 [Phaeodactylum tricornutum CCAP 1055/1]|jgi:pyruvate kinase|uniref:Pyruvate kinase n=2 Tax=Phaeodactylum tricornutum TaxID=2850 RepID=B7G961_PHATC|nr:kinase pyruvate kinase 5 [Phaeodactylum tricornutum CCAP 1055/1]EEC44766.1 kinase pyruvate kinase 5 [Phaeodactylum tricornutum CCAP 1055/1]|eukprot:XP_002183584.1 kinase pyruvate kinase 5 [Phaeodactylum tricornutum CCAP 1055/1]